MMERDKFVELLRDKLPEVFLRREVDELTGGIVKASRLNALASAKQGPPYVVRGNRAYYMKESFLAWLKETTYERA